jgi:PAS domain S-box-containing protein
LNQEAIAPEDAEALRARIQELEAQLAAAPPIDRESLYRMTNLSPWAVWSINRELRLDFANRATLRWMTCPPPAEGALVWKALHTPLARLLNAPVSAALNGTPYEAEHECAAPAGDTRMLRVVVAPRSSGPRGITGCVVNIHDLTEGRALDSAVRENEARLRLAVEAGRLAVWEYDVAARRLIGNEQLCRVLGYPPGSSPTAEEINAGYHPDDWARMIGVAQAALANGSYGVEAELRHTGPDHVQRTLLVRLEMLRDAAGEIYKGHGVVMDISERKQAEQGLQLVVNELNHRVKNTLATVQSLVHQSLRTVREPKQAALDLEARLLALADAHDLLTRENWEGAEVADVARRPGLAAPPGRLTLEGPNVRLTPKQALALSMAFHELMTNAYKHGAFSGPAGAVTLSWAVPRPRSLQVSWRESGGPAVAAPGKAGFGSRLLQRALAAELGGEVSLDFAREGLICRIQAPLAPSNERLQGRTAS